MSVRLPRRRTTRIAAGVVGGLVLVLIVAQLVLPGIAARIARDQLGKYGTVREINVRAFPAIELLWGRADSATLRAGDLDMSDSQFDSFVPRLRGIDRLDMTADGLQLGSLRVSDLRAEKRGEELAVYGTLTPADLRGALPAGVEVQRIENTGDGVEVRVGGSLFGVGASVLARLGAQDGKLVAQPQGFPFAGLGRITLFSDSRVSVQGVGLSVQAGAGEDPSYELTLRAKLL